MRTLIISTRYGAQRRAVDVVGVVSSRTDQHDNVLDVTSLSALDVVPKTLSAPPSGSASGDLTPSYRSVFETCDWDVDAGHEVRSLCFRKYYHIFVTSNKFVSCVS